MFRNLVISVILLAIIPNCDKPENMVDYALELEGEWICENQMQWEVMEFSRSGKCLYYNGIVAWNVENIHKCGSFYSIENNNITGVYSSSFNYVDLDFTILEISECEFTAKHNNTGIIKTYHKVIEECELSLDEPITPTCSTLLEAEIKQFKSHNDNIALVNERTGEIKAVRAGLVLIDVITESNDIAYVKIKVNGIMDLTPYLGLEQDRVFSIFGVPSSYTEESAHYSIRDNLVDFIQFHFNANRKVQLITLKLVENALPKDSIKEYLDKMYTRDNSTIEFDYLYYSPVAKITYLLEDNVILFSN